jgi:hypothetical protein
MSWLILAMFLVRRAMSLLRHAISTLGKIPGLGKIL